MSQSPHMISSLPESLARLYARTESIRYAAQTGAINLLDLKTQANRLRTDLITSLMEQRPSISDNLALHWSRIEEISSDLYEDSQSKNLREERTKLLEKCGCGFVEETVKTMDAVYRVAGDSNHMQKWMEELSLKFQNKEYKYPEKYERIFKLIEATLAGETNLTSISSSLPIPQLQVAAFYTYQMLYLILNEEGQNAFLDFGVSMFGQVGSPFKAALERLFELTSSR